MGSTGVGKHVIWWLGTWGKGKAREVPVEFELGGARLLTYKADEL